MTRHLVISLAVIASMSCVTENGATIDVDPSATASDGLGTQEGMLVHLQFDRDVGLFTDTSGNGNDAEVGRSGLPPFAVPGKVGDAIQSGSLRLPNTANLNFGTGDFTVAAWAKGTGSFPVLLSQRNVCGADTFWSLNTDGNQSSIETGNGPDWPNTYYGLVGPSPQNDGEWHHYAAVRAGFLLNLYIDGSLAASTFAPPSDLTFTSPTPVEIFANTCGDYGESSVALDDVLIYARSFSQDDIGRYLAEINKKPAPVNPCDPSPCAKGEICTLQQGLCKKGVACDFGKPVCIAPKPKAACFWDAAAEVMTAEVSGNPTNPNGAWSYFYAPGNFPGTIEEFASSEPVYYSPADHTSAWFGDPNLRGYVHDFGSAVPMVVTNMSPDPTGHFTPYGAHVNFAELLYHPGLQPGRYNSIRWTAPVDNSYVIDASWRFGHGAAVDYAVMWNKSFPLGTGTSSPEGSTFSTVVQLSAGDTIDFAIGFGSAFSGATTGVEAKIHRYGIECPKVCEDLNHNGICDQFDIFPTETVTYSWVASGFGPCSVSCGRGGTRTQTVTCTGSDGSVDPTKTLCDPRTLPASLEACDMDPCPVDCVQDSAGFGPCSASCGGGTQTEYLSTVVFGAYGGAACRDPIIQACNTQACVTYSWRTGDYGACSASCGGGQTTRSVTCVGSDGSVDPTETQCNLDNKPPTVDHCNTQACPVDCQVSAFGAFGACSASCGGGTQTQTREVLVPAANGGAACPALSNSRACNTQSCVTYAWQAGSFGSCAPSNNICGSGTQTRPVSCMGSDGIPGAASLCSGAAPSGSQSCTSACSTPQGGQLVAIACPPDADWSPHGSYVSCVAHETNRLVGLGWITGAQKGQIQSDAGQSDIGKK